MSGNIRQIFLLRSNELHLFDDAAFEKTDAQAFDRFFTSHFLAYAPWGHLYKTQIIREAGLMFNTDVVVGEDALFNYQYLQHCNRITTTREVVYYYNRLNSGSITKNYCPSRSKNELLVITERRKMYPDKLTAAQQYKEDDMLLFLFSRLCQDYTFFLPRGSAAEKLRETHLMYRPLLESMGAYEGAAVQSESIRSWLEYRHFLEDGDYEGLYDHFASRRNYRQVERRHPMVRKLLTWLRNVQLFQLKIGYR